MTAIKTLKEVEGALPKKNEVNYVRALDAQGNPILVSKQDLATVLGELLNIADLNHKGLSDRLQATYRFELSSQEIIAFEDLEYGWYQITESSNIGMGSLFSLTYQGIKLIRHTEEASSIESTLTVQGEGGGKRKITITNKLDRNVRCTLNKI